MLKQQLADRFHMEASLAMRAALEQWMLNGNATFHPLTFPQRELWEASPIPVTDPANHISCLIEIKGDVVPEACEMALRRVAERQEALRIAFIQGKKRPVQMVRKNSDVNFQYVTPSASQTTDEAVEEAATRVAGKPFDLLRGALCRVEVIRRGPKDHVIILVLHHAIGDGWALGLLFRELCNSYFLPVASSDAGLPDLPVTYTTWAKAERDFWHSGELERRGAFWKSFLSGNKRLWNSFEGPLTASGALPQRVCHFPHELAEAISVLARTNGATLFTTLLTAFQIALSRWTGDADVLVGTPVANRASRTVWKTMGYFAGIVPFRGQVEGDRTFSDSLRIVHQTAADCLANAMPFVELASALGDFSAPGHNPVFETRFALQNHPIPRTGFLGWSATLKKRCSSGTARFHLGCEITTLKQGLEVVWLYRAALFPATEIDRLADLFKAVVVAACRSPESRVKNLGVKYS
ncbi:MAG TPA: condensation domain-containing protein [Chthoniobacterales bacterium]